ncbi:MAG: adenosine deaminase [Spirochaetaceae bacterium]|nr:MAG: adenosine deaminase [Spirochaetaceae bacterium]
MDGNIQSTEFVSPDLDHTTLLQFPKVELHRHLEGTFELQTLFTMSVRNGIDLPTDFPSFKKEVQFPKDSEPDFLKFLSKFRNNWYRSHEDVWNIAYESMRAFADDGLHYIEVRFSPEHFALHNDFDRLEVTKMIVEAGNKAAEETDTQIRYLLTFNRSRQTQEEMLELYRKVMSLNLAEIVGIDLAGDELNYPPELFVDFFKAVRSDGACGTTIHAGEVTPPKQVWDALNVLNADRIGHGTSSIEDKNLQRYLTDNGITLEQCITSNRQTGSWTDEENHPLGRLYKAGVPVTINSDDPTIQDSDLTDDYVKAVRYFDLTVDDLVKLNHIAIDATFLPHNEKEALRASYDAAVRQFRSAQSL